MSLQLSQIVAGMTLKATVQNFVDNAANPNAQVALGVAFAQSPPLGSGVAALQADRMWQSTGRVLVSAANETINLYSFAGIDIGAGAGNGPLGGAMAQIAIVAVLVINRATSIGNMVVGGQGTANAWLGGCLNANTSTLTFHPGGGAMLFDPSATAFTVGAASNNLLQVAASGGNITYDIYVLGRQ